MTSPSTLAPARANPGLNRALIARAALPLAVLLAFVFFALFADGFTQWSNIRGLLVNNFALLAIVALAMTLAVHSGGIDLSVATAIDLASLAFVATIAAGYGVTTGILAGLAAAGAAVWAPEAGRAGPRRRSRPAPDDAARRQAARSG